MRAEVRAGRGILDAIGNTPIIELGAIARPGSARILAKLELRDRVQAVVLAYETGLARPGIS